MPAKLIVYIGGIRSGKSRLAEARFSKELKGKPWKAAYLATMDAKLGAKDASLRARISEHQARRPAAWQTVELGAKLALAKGCSAYLLDGLGLWAALKLGQPGQAKAELGVFLKELRSKARLAVLVLDETGLGGISANRAQRRFADLNGELNQMVCAQAAEAWSVQAGLKTRLK